MSADSSSLLWRRRNVNWFSFCATEIMTHATVRVATHARVAFLESTV